MYLLYIPYHPSTQDGETGVISSISASGESGVQGHLQLYSEFEAKMGNKRLFHQVKEKEIFKRVGKHTLGIFVITFIGVLEKTFKCYLLKKLYVGNQLTSTVGILQIIS